MNRTFGSDGAFLTSVAGGLVKVRDALANDADVVQLRLDAVVGTSADGNLKFVREGGISISVEIFLLQFVCEGECVMQAIAAGSPFAGDDGADFRAGAADDEAAGFDGFGKSIQIFDRDAGDLKCLTRGEQDITRAVFLSGIGNAFQLFRGDAPVLCDNTGRKIIGVLVVEKAASFQLFFFLFRDGKCCHGLNPFQ